MAKMLKLNIGCGRTKIKGYVNIDGEISCKPDLVLDVTKRRLPYPAGSINEIVMFHCIEHIDKCRHRTIFLDFGRVLRKGGNLLLSYPNFWECAKRWNDNTQGQKTFWEATIYGRQLYPGDYHVCIVDPAELAETLYGCGFDSIKSYPEPKAAYYNITSAVRVRGPAISYEKLLAEDMKETRSDVVTVGKGKEF